MGETSHLPLNEDEKELLRRLCKSLTADIVVSSNNTWLKPALVSHIAQLSKVEYKKVSDYVEWWWSIQ